MSVEAIAFQLGTFVAGMAFHVEHGDRWAASRLLRDATMLARQLGLGAPRVPQAGDEQCLAIERLLRATRGSKVADSFALGFAISMSSEPTWDSRTIETLARRLEIPEAVWRASYEVVKLAPTSSEMFALVNAFAAYLAG